MPLPFQMIGIFCFSSITFAESAIEYGNLYKNSLISPIALEKHHYWINIQAAISPFVGLNPGLTVEAGYWFTFFSIDGRAILASTDYQTLKATSSYGDSETNFTSGTDPESELNRSRSNSANWSYQLVEVGLSVLGRLFPDFVPSLTERVRFGFGMGLFQDNANKISFNGREFSFETGLIWQITKEQPWSVYGAISYHWGVLNSTAADISGSQAGRLPVTWSTTSLGVIYSF